MLAPIRDYLGPKDPQSFPLLHATRDHYFSRLLVDVGPNKPGFAEARWIASEDVNIEHLLDVFTSIDQHWDDIWDACFHFMEHLYWHKPQQTTLRSKIESLPDDNRYKSRCLFWLSRLFQRVGNDMEEKRLLTRTLELKRQQGDDIQVAQTLRFLSDANRRLGLHEDGIRQVKEALGISERTGNTNWQIWCLNGLAQLLFADKQLDTAEEVSSRALNLISGKKGQEYVVCQLNQVLGQIHQSKGEERKAIHHFETALGIASAFNWHDILFWTHFFLARLFRDEEKFDNAHAQIERAKAHAVNDEYKLGRATRLQADFWYRQHILEVAESEVLQALEIFEKLGAVKDVKNYRRLLQKVERAM